MVKVDYSVISRKKETSELHKGMRFLFDFRRKGQSHIWPSSSGAKLLFVETAVTLSGLFVRTLVTAGRIKDC